MFETTRRHLYLAGFMGTGKTAIGRATAGRLGRGFIDLDSMIEQMCRRSIAGIFRDDGEERFRQIESRALRLAIVAPGSVIALGGGTPTIAANVCKIGQTGYTVLLTAEWEVIWNRVRERIHDRPLLSMDRRGTPVGNNTLVEFVARASPLLEARWSAYQSIANRRIDTSGLSIDDTADEIAQWYSGAGQKAEG